MDRRQPVGDRLSGRGGAPDVGAPWIAVPAVLDHGADADGSWLVTAAVPGRSARRSAVDRPARGRRDCNRTGLRVCTTPAGRRMSLRLVGRMATVGPPRSDRTPPGPSSAHHRIDRLVVCHGDACAPNTLLDDGTVAAHVDLGALGLADRWADLAVAAWSTRSGLRAGLRPPRLRRVRHRPRRRAHRVLPQAVGRRVTVRPCGTARRRTIIPNATRPRASAMISGGP